MDWADTAMGRGRRERQAPRSVPEQLPQSTTELGSELRALLQRWVRDDEALRKRSTLLGKAGGASIEQAEALCGWLLQAGWIARRERLVGGQWQWDAIVWRDLARLQALLEVLGPAQRKAQRAQRLDQAQAWLQARSDTASATALDPDLLDELALALAQLRQDGSLRPELLEARLALLEAIAAWHDGAAQGTRRDFALRARDGTKALTAAEWRWLESQFDLERLRITRFAPVLWLAGALRLQWQAHGSDLWPLHCLGLPQADVLRADGATGPARWWLIENRASFERQAQRRTPGLAMVWLPGRPATGWLQAMDHLLALAPAPAWISADADPAGIDIACAAGALWEARALPWEAHQMGLAQWEGTPQRWPLNAHDRQLLDRLLQRPALPAALRTLGQAMQRAGRKAEQEAWL